MSARSNEIEKLTATLCNTLAAASIITGVLSPVSVAFGQTATHPAGDDWIFIISSLSWLLFGLVLHIAGRAWLERRFLET